MAQIKQGDLKQAAKQPVATWNIQNFPIALRRGFMAAAHMEGKTGKQLLVEHLTIYLTKFFNGEIPNFEQD